MMSSQDGPRPMRAEDMIRALSLLDAEIGQNDLLMSVAPIRLISVGGSLAVYLFANRESSWDIDCLLDPNVAADDDYAEEFKAAVLKVSEKAGLEKSWLNRDLETFVARPKRMSLFLESIAQGIVLHEGENLQIYAGRLDWALERKVRRIAHAARSREGKGVDLSDAAALVKRLVEDGGGEALTFEYIRGLNLNGFDLPPGDAALRRLASFYLETYGSVGLTEG